MKKLHLLYNALRATLQDSQVNLAYTAYRHNLRQIKRLYKQAVSQEREELGKLVANTFKAKYSAEKIKSGEYETVFD